MRINQSTRLDQPSLGTEDILVRTRGGCWLPKNPYMGLWLASYPSSDARQMAQHCHFQSRSECHDNISNIHVLACGGGSRAFVPWYPPGRLALIWTLSSFLVVTGKFNFFESSHREGVDTLQPHQNPYASCSLHCSFSATSEISFRDTCQLELETTSFFILNGPPPHFTARIPVPFLALSTAALSCCSSVSVHLTLSSSHFFTLNSLRNCV